MKLIYNIIFLIFFIYIILLKLNLDNTNPFYNKIYIFIAIVLLQIIFLSSKSITNNKKTNYDKIISKSIKYGFYSILAYSLYMDLLIHNENNIYICDMINKYNIIILSFMVSLIPLITHKFNKLITIGGLNK